MNEQNPGAGGGVHDRYHDTAYMVVCRDGPHGEELRAAHAREHLAYVETVLGELNVAGPLYDEGGIKPVGSIFCVGTKSLARARQIIENDPYYKGGVFESVEFFPYLPAAGRYIGGKIW
jgi:uncharacterized protein